MIRRASCITVAVSCSLVAQQRIPRQPAVSDAALQGIVRTTEKAGAGGMHIVLRNAATGEDRIDDTNADGVFLIRDIPPGTYSLRATSDIYQPIERAGLSFSAGDVMTLDLTTERLGTPVPDLRGPALLGTTPRVPEAAGEPWRKIPRDIEPVKAMETMAEPAADEDIFVPKAARWLYDFPAYRRYNVPGEYPYVKGHRYNSFNLNKLKGDYPIFGTRTFASLTVASETFADGRRLPTPSLVAAERPGSSNFFGRPGQFFLDQTFIVSLDLFHGDTAFRPVDWRIKVTPQVSVNYLATQERGIVNIDPRSGTSRLDAHAGLQEAFVEAKIADLSNQYDFVSARAGIQTFRSDFRGFIFSDQEPGLRIFGNLKSNRYQYNLAAFTMLEKDTNSGLNRFEYRGQQVYIANLYRQDFLRPGYTLQVSFHYDKDDATFKFNANNFLVRPAPIGAVKPHAIRAFYYGIAGDGHIGRFNLSHAFYQVTGHDTLNPLAGRRVNINAQMAAAELSLDKDWIRYRISFFYASGDKDPRDGTARGFDAIFDRPSFAGGPFSFWNREGIRLTGTGVAIVDGDSLIPSLRASKIQGQASFVNPGLFLYNAGTDIDITSKLRGFANFNLVRFARTAPLELLLFQKPVHAGAGADSGIGLTYRPPLTENVTITAGCSAFAPFRGFRDIYTNQTLVSLFTVVRFRF